MPKFMRKVRNLRLLKTLEEQTILKAEEKTLMQEWDELTVEIEQVESSEQKNFSGT